MANNSNTIEAIKQVNTQVNLIGRLSQNSSREAGKVFEMNGRLFEKLSTLRERLNQIEA